jgi:hypothetical protein
VLHKRQVPQSIGCARAQWRPPLLLRVIGAGCSAALHVSAGAALGIEAGAATCPVAADVYMHYEHLLRATATPASLDTLGVAAVRRLEGETAPENRADAAAAPALEASMREALWLGHYLSPRRTHCDLVLILQMYRVCGVLDRGRERESCTESLAVPSLVAGLCVAGRSAGACEAAAFHALPALVWMGNLSVPVALRSARCAAQRGVLAAAPAVARAVAPAAAPAAACPVSSADAGAGRWAHLREWWAAVQHACGADVDRLGADFVLLSPNGHAWGPHLGRAAAELWLTEQTSVEGGARVPACVTRAHGAHA